MRGLVLALVAGAALWAEGWAVVKGSETISAPGDVVQTTDGSLWWAAGAQVYRYDGRTFQPYGEAHGLGSRGAMILAAGPDGTLLVRTTEGVFRWEGERFRKIWSGPLGHMAAGPDGLVALGTYEGRLILGKDEKWNEFKYNFRLMGQVNFDRDGALRFGCNIVICEVGREKLADWATLTEKDLRKVEPRVLAEPGMPVLGMAKDRWGRVWIRDWQRLFVGERAEGPYREVKVASAGGTNPPILRLSPGRVMYFNGPDGLYWGNAKGELERAPGDDSENGGFHVAYWDKQGGIWVGRRGKGLVRREAAELLTRRWGTAEGLRDPVFGVHEWGGRTVAGTMQGVYELEAGGRRWRALPETMVKYGGAPALATSGDGALLVGVNRGAPVLARVERDGRVGKTYHVPPVQDGPNVYSLLRDPRGFLWVGSSRRLYRAVERGTEVETTPVELGVRPLGADIYAMQLDEKLRLLAPTTYGLFRVDGDRVERFTVKDGFRFAGVRFIGRDGKGRYWVSYANKPGVARVEFPGAGMNVEHPAEDVEVGTVEDILVDRRGWVWLTDDRATWVNRTGGLEAAAFQRVGENVPELAKGGNTMSMFEDSAGRIWIGGAEGLARVEDPERFVEEDVDPPPVVVRGLAFSGYAGEGLTARLSTAWLRGMDGVRFRWRLGGGAWQVSEDGTVRVGEVPAGDFVLEAQAEDKEGAWRSAMVRVPVGSVVPWWRATWFWWLVGVVGLSALGWVVGRVRKAREEAAAYAAAKLAYLDEMPLFGEKYRGLEVIATGAFATVYRAEDETGRAVAVKRMHAEDLAAKALEREVESLRRISHPGVVGVLDFAVAGERGAYLVLDYVPGPTLREVLKQGPLERGRVARFARQLGEALGAAHAAGVIHRDLKPENIILRPEEGGERAVIVDFGIAVCRTLGKTSAQASNVGGTLFYLAPEQLAGVARPSADIYSFGVILCEVLTGRCPEISEDGGLEGRAEAARLLLAGDAATELICAAMDYEPSRRPKDAAELGAAVAAAIS